MLVRQAKNAFIRFYDGEGYIMNQMTRYDRVYNETGADFLREISRTSKDINSIIDNLSRLYGDSVTRERLFNDFMQFVHDLENHYFLVTGETEEECSLKDIDFSYSNSILLKTNTIDFTQSTTQTVNEYSSDLMLEADQRKAQLKSIQFELTSRCNERCIHCYIPNSKKNLGKDMPFERFCNILDQFSEMGGFHVSLSGGEVFLYKDIIRAIQYCRQKDMEICVLSNLISLRDDQIPLIKEANVSYIQCSLYSMIPEIHDTITTVKGSHEKTLNNIKKLIAADIPVQISCPLMKANKDSYVDVLRFAQENKIKAFSDYILMGEADLSTDNLRNRLSLDDTKKVIRDIMQYDLDYPRWIKEKRPYIEKIDKDRYAKQALCGVGLNNICITEDGNLYPCPGWQSMVVGNIKEKSLKEIWEKSPKLKMLRQITHSDFPQCIECEARKFCTMCLERNCNENDGNIFKVSEHFCNVAFIHKKLYEDFVNKGMLY